MLKYDITIIYSDISRPTILLDDLADLVELDHVNFRDREIACSVTEENLDIVQRLEEVETLGRTHTPPACLFVVVEIRFRFDAVEEVEEVYFF